MLRLTKKSDYGLIALKHLAEHPDTPTQSAKDMAELYHIPLPLLAKVLQTLARSGLVISHAGLHGGYSLARLATEITVLEVIRSIEGSMFIVSCTTDHGDCDLLNSCIVKEPLQKLNDTIRNFLGQVRISDLCGESRLGTPEYTDVAHANPPVRLNTSTPTRIYSISPEGVERKNVADVAVPRRTATPKESNHTIASEEMR